MKHKMPLRNEHNGAFKQMPCRADSLPAFREAFPTPDSIDLDGAKALSTAILLTLAQDYYNVCMDKPVRVAYGTSITSYPKYTFDQLCGKELCERFFESELFEAITDIHPDFFRRKIIELRKAGLGLPKISDYQTGTGSCVVPSRHMQRVHRHGKH